MKIINQISSRATARKDLIPYPTLSYLHYLQYYKRTRGSLETIK